MPQQFFFSHTLIQGNGELIIFLVVHQQFLFVCDFSDTPRYRGMVSELDCWMEWIENQMAEEVYDTPTVDDLDEFIGGISYLHSSSFRILMSIC